LPGIPAKTYFLAVAEPGRSTDVSRGAGLKAVVSIRFASWRITQQPGKIFPHSYLKTKSQYLFFVKLSTEEIKITD